MTTHRPLSDTVNLGDIGVTARTVLRKVAPNNPQSAPTVPERVARPRVAVGTNRVRSAFLDELVAPSGPEDTAQQKSLAERDALNAKLQKLQDQVAELELVRRQLSAIEGSTSWRMTYPLRRLVHGTFFVHHATTELVKRAWRTGTGLPYFGRARPKADGTVSREPASLTRSMNNLGKWEEWYKDLALVAGPQPYGDQTTYRMAAAFFVGQGDVEDWGCGRGGFRLSNLNERYLGLDGSYTPFADKIVDLCTYRSKASCILIRHVLEHNYDWQGILDGAIASFQKKLCLILFTPFTEQTKEIAHNLKAGVDVPDLSFKPSDIEERFGSLPWKLVANIRTDSQYGTEHVYFVWREPKRRLV